MSLSKRKKSVSCKGLSNETKVFLKSYLHSHLALQKLCITGKRSIFQTFWKTHLCMKFQILKFLLLCYFLLLCKVSARLDNIDIRHFIRVFDFLVDKKTSKGDPYKISDINVVQSC